MATSFDNLLEEKSSKRSDLKIGEILQQGFAYFIKYWVNLFFFSVLIMVIIGAVTIGSAYVNSIFREMGADQGLTIILSICSGALLIYLLGALTAGYYCYLSGNWRDSQPPAFSDFWKGFTHGKTYLGLLILLGLIFIATAAVFGLVDSLIADRSFRDYNHDIEFLTDIFLGINSGGSLQLFSDYWIIAIPLFFLSTITCLAFPLAASYELTVLNSIKYSIQISIVNFRKVFILFLITTSIVYLVGQSIQTYLEYGSYYQTGILFYLGFFSKTLITSLSPCIFFALAEAILGSSRNNFSDLVDEQEVDSETNPSSTDSIPN